MGFSKEERRQRFVRWIKTLFFLITMLISLLLFSAPILLVIADAIIPSALLSASISLNLHALSSHLNNYDFRSSLIDIPLVSIIRSAIILFVYSFCDGPRLSKWPYLGIATICSVLSLVFVSLKAAYVFSDSSSIDRRGYGYSRAVEVTLFVCSFGLAIGHVIVAYRTSCRERRKLLVYKIDIEAVSACKNGFPRHYKLLKGRRAKPRQKQISIPHFFLKNQIQFSKSQVSDLSKGDVQPDEEIKETQTQKL